MSNRLIQSTVKFSIKGYFFIIFSFLLSITPALAQHNDCSQKLDQATPPELKKLIEDLNPFWGTWRGTYKGDPVVGEFTLDQNNNVRLKGNLGSKSITNRTVKFCLRRGRFTLSTSFISANVEIVNSRTLRFSGLLIQGTITLRR